MGSILRWRRHGGDEDGGILWSIVPGAAILCPSVALKEP